MLLGRVVGRRGDHLAADAPAHLGHFLGPLVDQEDDQVHLGMVLRDGGGDLLEQDRLARPRRRDDQAALALADRREQVHDPHPQRLGAGLQADPLVGVDGRQVVEAAEAEVLLGRPALDLGQLGQPRRLRPAAGVSTSPVSRTPWRSWNLREQGRADVDVVVAGLEVPRGVAEEPVAPWDAAPGHRNRCVRPCS